LPNGSDKKPAITQQENIIKGGIKFCNAEFEKLIDEARATPDQKKRIALYERAQEIFKQLSQIKVIVQVVAVRFVNSDVASCQPIVELSPGVDGP